MEQAFLDLIEFELACGHEPSRLPPGHGISDSLIKQRIRLIQEEFDEFLDAVHADGSRETDAKVADSLADLCYVVIGTAVRFGIDLPAVWKAVHQANMAKHGPGAWKDETGKVRKPPGWLHPDIESLLAQQKPLAEIYGGNGYIFVQFPAEGWVGIATHDCTRFNERNNRECKADDDDGRD